MEVECLGVSFCWCSQLGWRFCDDGGRSGGGRFRIDGESCCEAVLGLFKWEDVLLVAVESNASGRDNIQCQWASLWYADAGRFFFRLLFSLNSAHL